MPTKSGMYIDTRGPGGVLINERPKPKTLSYSQRKAAEFQQQYAAEKAARAAAQSNEMPSSGRLVPSNPPPKD